MGEKIITAKGGVTIPLSELLAGHKPAPQPAKEGK